MRVLQFPAVQTNRRYQLAALMAIHLAWGLVLWFSISKYGLGISTDSVQLLFGGQNLVAGNGLTSFDGSFVKLWPPLYPVLLGFVHLITGSSMLQAATIVQATAFLGLSLCSSILFLRAFPSSFALALAANVLADIGAVVLTSFDVVDSDYVALFLIMLALLLLSFYLKTGSARTFVALAMAGALTMLDRYLGVAAIVTSVICVVWLTSASPGRKLARGILLAVGAVPAGTWWAVSSGASGLRGPISFAENFSWFSKSMLEWFFETKTVKANLDLYTALLWIAIVGLLGLEIAGWIGYRRERAAGRESAPDDEEAGPGFNATFVTPVLTFGAVYTFALFGTASFAFFNKLGGRFLLPLYIPFVTLLITAVALLLHATRKAAVRRLAGAVAGAALLIATAVLLLQVTLPLVSASHTDGAAGGDNVFNTKAWNKNQAILYWLAQAPQGRYQLISNEPDAVAFFTGHPTLTSPRSTSGPYATDNFALSSYPPQLFSSGEPVYLIWIEPSPAPYFYTVDELSAISQVEPMFTSIDGGVYRLIPKAD